MSTFAQTRRIPLDNDPFVRRIPFLDRFRARRTARQLRALDDHLLRDIGLSRSDIETALDEGRL
jgi:hypothetical protein